MEKAAEKISPEKAIEILKKDGIEVAPNEAIVILEFFYRMAEIAIEQCLEKAR